MSVKQVQRAFNRKLGRVKTLLGELVSTKGFETRGFQLIYYDPPNRSKKTVQKFEFFGSECPQKCLEGVDDNATIDLMLEDVESVENVDVSMNSQHDIMLDVSMSSQNEDEVQEIAPDSSFDISVDIIPQDFVQVDMGNGEIVDVAVGVDFGEEDREVVNGEAEDADIFAGVKFPDDFHVDKCLLDKIRKFNVETITKLPVVESMADFEDLVKTTFGKIIRDVFFDNILLYHKQKATEFSININDLCRRLVPSFSLLYDEAQSHVFFMRNKQSRFRFLEYDVRESLIKSLFEERKIADDAPITLEDVEFINKIIDELNTRAEWNETNSVPAALRELGMYNSSNCARAKRILHILNWEARPLMRLKPQLVERSRNERLDFAMWFRAKLENDPFFHRKWLISDEMRMVLRSGKIGNRFTWVPKGTVLQPPSYGQKYDGGSVMVAALVGYGYKGPLFFCTEDSGKKDLDTYTLDSEAYISKLLPFWVEDLKGKGMVKEGKLLNGVLFQQDGAPCHWSKKSLAYLEEQFGLENIISRKPKNIPKGDPNEKIPKMWPGNSPDISCLDYTLWNTFKRRSLNYLYKKDKMQFFRNRRHCQEILQYTWDNLISIEDINNAIDGMPKRIDRVILAKGGLTEGYVKVNRGGLEKK